MSTPRSYLVIGGPVSREPAQFDLWLWSGQPGAPARRVTIPGLQGLEHAEGASPAVIGGVQRIVIKAGRHARYVLLAPDQLKTQPVDGSGARGLPSRALAGVEDCAGTMAARRWRTLRRRPSNTEASP